MPESISFKELALPEAALEESTLPIATFGSVDAAEALPVEVSMLPQNSIAIPTMSSDSSSSVSLKTCFMKPTPEQLRLTQLEKELQYSFQDIRYYRRRLKEEKRKGDQMFKECVLKIARVRSFWKDKIYNEGTRGGKIVKTAMQS